MFKNLLNKLIQLNEEYFTETSYFDMLKMVLMIYLFWRNPRIMDVFG